MNRSEKNEILSSEINQIKDFYAQQGYLEDSDMHQIDSHTLILYKVYNGEEYYLRVQVGIPTGSRDGSLEDPSIKAAEYKKNVEKHNRIKKRYEKIRNEKEKKDKELEVFQNKIFEFLNTNKDKSYSSMNLSKELSINLSDTVACLRKMSDLITKIDNGKSVPFTYKVKDKLDV